jgi:hypothetical protein
MSESLGGFVARVLLELVGRLGVEVDEAELEAFIAAESWESWGPGVWDELSAADIAEISVIALKESERPHE